MQHQKQPLLFEPAQRVTPQSTLPSGLQSGSSPSGCAPTLPTSHYSSEMDLEASTPTNGHQIHSQQDCDNHRANGRPHLISGTGRVTHDVATEKQQS